MAFPVATRRPVPSRAAPRRDLVVLGVLAALLPLTAASCQPAPRAQPEGPAPAVAAQDDLGTLLDATAPAEARAAACRRLLASPEVETRRALVALLGPDKRAADVQQVLLREIAAASNVSEAFLPALEGWLKESTPDKHPPLYRAISSIRTRKAARLLLSYAGPSTTAENREVIMQALTRLSGRAELGSDRDAWERWLSAAEKLTEQQWRDQLAMGLAQRTDALRSQRDDALRRLAESERTRYLESTEAKARSAILASLLRDELPILRRLGIELVNRELANAREPGPDVGAAALELLADPSAEVRSAGADLVDRLVPADASIAVREALARERDPNVLAKLLRLARRFPDVAPPELIMGWLGADTAVRRAAIDAVAARQTAGLLASPIDLERALQTLRSERPEALSADGLKLLCELGTDGDRDTVARLLALPSGEARLHAAQALAPFPERLDAILAAAQLDPALFSVAAGALAKNRPTLEGYRALVALPAATPAAMREAVTSFCQRLAVPDLVAAARSTTEAGLRESILNRVIDLTATNSADASHDPFAGADAPALVEALLLLAESQLDSLKPGVALGTLDLLRPAGDGAAARAAPLYAKAYLYLDRMDEAIDLNAAPQAWLDALEYAVTLPHALAIAAEIEYRYGSTLNAEQKERLQQLIERAKHRPHPSADGEGR